MYSCPSHRCVVRETSQSGDGVRLWKVYGLVSFGSWWGKKTQHILVTDADWICSHPCIQMMQRFMLSSALAAHLYSGITGKKMSGGSLHICVCVCVCDAMLLFPTRKWVVTVQNSIYNCKWLCNKNYCQLF